MERKSFFFLMILFLGGVCSLFAQAFEFKYQPGVRYQVKNQIVEDVYKNGEYSHTSRVVIMEWLNVVSQEAEDFFIVGDYSVSEDTSSLGLAYQQKNEYLNNLYRMNSYGKFFSDKDNFMPVKRDFPLFKEGLKRDDRWFSSTYEVHDFRGELFGIEYPYRIPSAVIWHYAGVKEVDGVVYQLLTARLSILYEPNPVPALYRRYPVSISGYSDIELLWNEEKGLIHSIKEQFDISFDISDGQQFQYKGHSLSSFEKMESIPEGRYAELVQMIKDRFGEDGQVERGDGWVRITLNNINFGPEDYTLVEDEKKKLEIIAEEVAKHEGRFVKVAGHTALAGTEEGRTSLSLLRAQVVRDFLIEKEAISPEMITIEGKGATEQKDFSGTREGNERNRRVEIYIMVGNDEQERDGDE